MSDTTQHDQDIQKLGDLIKDVKVAMMATVDETDGSLRSRPMQTLKREFDGDIYFFTHASDPKVDEVQQENHVNLSYASPDNDRYISVSGKATIERDHEKMKSLWNPVFKAWFPDGLEDPDLALLKVHAEKAEFWDTPNGVVVHLLGVAKALATHQPYHAGENKKLDLEASHS